MLLSVCSERLDRCLLTEEEMAVGPSGWAEYDDPLPVWGVEYEESTE
jgi:hypothetical protein